MGYSVRTADGWRYTAWYAWDNVTLDARWDDGPLGGVELYAHAAADAAEAVSGSVDFDATENVNVADAFPDVAARLARRLVMQFRTAAHSEIGPSVSIREAS